MKESDLTHTIVAELSHPGEKRTENEDRYAVINYRTEVEKKPAILAVVADGIGGHRAGEIAAPNHRRYDREQHNLKENQRSGHTTQASRY